MKGRRRLPLIVVLATAWATSFAHAADRYVSVGGHDTANDCLTSTTPCATVSRATSQASSGDTINVASGSYRDNIRMVDSATLAFLGGWDATFTSRDALKTPSILKGGRVHLPSYTGHERVWSILAWNGTVIHATIDGFVLTGGHSGTRVIPDNVDGNAAANARAAGGLAAVAASDSAVTLRMSNTVVTRNRDDYGGAGLSLWALDNSSLDVTLDTVQVTHNKSASPGAGGGILVFDAPYSGESSAITFRLSNAVVAYNSCWGSGGGVLLSNYGSPGSRLDAAIVSSTITHNSARNAKCPPTGCLHLGGGGIYTIATAGPMHVTMTDTILRGNRLIGPGAGIDLFNNSTFGDNSTSPSMLTLDEDHDDIGDIVLQGGTFNDLGGNVSTDPMLDRAYELEAGSPLIDAGTCTGVPSTDFEGDPRPSGTGCDIGADEFQF